MRPGDRLSPVSRPLDACGQRPRCAPADARRDHSDAVPFMKVLIPNFAVPDSFVDNVAHTLRALGHEAITAPNLTSTPSARALNVLQETVRRAFPARWHPAEKWAVAAVRETRPDLVLCLTQSLREEVLETLRAAGVRHLVAWWGDTPANMRGMGLLARGWDRIFLKDGAAVRKFQAVGLPAEQLHEACNPDWHRRAFDSVGGDVVVAGSCYGYRQFLGATLLGRGVPLAIYGPSPPRWSDPAIRAAHRGRYIVKDEKSRIFGSGLACLNSTALSEGDALNCRAFEIAGACGLQLIEDKPSVAACFEPGREVLTYRSTDEIVDHLARARAEPAWAMAVRQAGHARAHAEHTYAARLRHLFATLRP